jgi:site-specific DNA recombinase
MTLASPFPPGSQVVAYLRDSGGTDQDLSVDQQDAAVRAWCLEAGLQLTRVFHDDARPGSSVVGRDAFLEMITYFHHSRVPERGVILWKYSRFSRDIDDAQYYKADLRRLGYQIYSITDNIPDTADGRIYESLIDWMNSRFLLDLATDVKRGLHHNFDQYGALPGTPPRGFKREVIDLGKRRDGSSHQVARWVPDPETWERCKLAWKLRAAGATYRQINEKVHLYKSINCYKTFFTNRIYLGEMRFGDSIMKGYVEKMIDDPTWDAVQRMRDRNQSHVSTSDSPRHPRRLGSSFLLSGLLFCARCGAPMNGNIVHFAHHQKVYEYYICSRAGQTHECTARRIPRKALEIAIFKTLRDFILDPEVSARRQRDMLTMQEENRHDSEIILEGLRKNLKKIQSEISNLNDILAEEGAAAPRSTRERLISLEREELLEKAQISNQKSILENNFTTVAPRDVSQITSRLQQALEHENPENLKLMLNGIIQRICAERDDKVIRGMVYFYHPPEMQTPPSGSGGGAGEPETFMPKGQCLHRDTTFTHKIYSIPFSYSIK